MKIPNDLIENYKYFVTKGTSIASGKRLVVGGLARNCSHKINGNMERIEKLCSHFDSSRVVIFENNSSDGTKEVLKHHLSDRIYDIGYDDTEEFTGGFLQTRIKRMARYRTDVQSEIRANYSDYDYVLILDFDVIDWSIDGVLTSLAFDGEFDMMGSFSHIYHPSLNSSDGWINHDRWAFKFHSWEEEFSTNQTSDLIWFWYWKPPPGAYPVRCLSSFGGLGIYNMEAYLSGEYGYKHPFQSENETTSEHNEFHRSMSEKGYDRVYLNPSQRCVIGP